MYHELSERIKKIIKACLKSKGLDSENIASSVVGYLEWRVYQV